MYHNEANMINWIYLNDIALFVPHHVFLLSYVSSFGYNRLDCSARIVMQMIFAQPDKYLGSEVNGLVSCGNIS